MEAAQRAISSPLLEDTSIEGAKGVLLNIAGGRDLTLHEVAEAARIIQEAVDLEANIISGMVIDDQMADEMKVTVIATGFDRSADRPADLEGEVPVVRRPQAPVERPQPATYQAAQHQAPQHQPATQPAAHQPVQVRQRPAARPPVQRPEVRQPAARPEMRQEAAPEPYRPSSRPPVQQAAPQQAAPQAPAQQAPRQPVIPPVQSAEDNGGQQQGFEDLDEVPFYRKALAQRLADDGGYGPNWSNVDDYDIPTVLRKQMD